MNTILQYPGTWTSRSSRGCEPRPTMAWSVRPSSAASLPHVQCGHSPRCWGAFDRGSPQRTGIAQRSAVPQPLGPGRSFKGLGVVKRYCSTDLIGNTTSHRAESQEGLLPGSLSAGASYFCASALNSRPPRSARSSATSARSSGTALETIDFPGASSGAPTEAVCGGYAPSAGTAKTQRRKKHKHAKRLYRIAPGVDPENPDHAGNGRYGEPRDGSDRQSGKVTSRGVPELPRSRLSCRGWCR